MQSGTRVVIDNDCVIVHIVGDVDIATAPQLRSLLVRHLDDGWTRVVVDLGESEFIDSTGLGTLLGFLRRVRERDGLLELVVPGDKQRRILTACDLDRIFTLHPDLASARASISSARRPEASKK